MGTLPDPKFERSTAIHKNLGQASKQAHGGVYRVAPQLKVVWK